MNANAPAPVDEPAGERREQQDRQPEHRERQPDQVEPGAEVLEEQAPDDLVGAAREVAAGVDHEGRDQAAVPEARRGARSVLAAGSAVGVEVRGGPPRRWRARRGGNSVASGRRGRVRPLSRSPCPRRAMGDGGEPRGDAAEDEHERDPAEPRRPRARRSPGRAAARPSGPRRTARTPRRGAPAASRRSGSRARPGRRSPSTSPAPARRMRNASGPVKTSGRRLKTPVDDEADDHQRDARRPVGEPAEDRLADEAGRRPGGDDDPEEREVDALLREVQGQDRQQRPEAEPDDELGEQQRDDVAPALGPAR